MLEYRGVSGATFRHTLQAERRQERIRAHAQWFRAGRGAHVACHRGELSANGWFGDDPGGSAALCGHGSNSREALRVCPTENRSSGNLREKFFGARDEHTISSLLSRAKVSAAAVPVGLAGGGASGLFHWGNRGHAGGGRFLRTVRRRRAAEQSVRSEDAVEGAGVRVRKRGVQLAQDRQEAGRGCGVSGSGRGEFSRSSHGEPVSAGAFGGVRGDLRASGEVGAGDEADRNGDAGDRRDQGAGKREQAQGDELWANEGRGAKVEGRNRGVAAAGAGGGRSRR